MSSAFSIYMFVVSVYPAVPLSLYGTDWSITMVSVGERVCIYAECKGTITHMLFTEHDSTAKEQSRLFNSYIITLYNTIHPDYIIRSAARASNVQTIDLPHIQTKSKKCFVQLLMPINTGLIVLDAIITKCNLLKLQ